MKKLILLALTSFFSFSLYSQVYWEKHPDNPVLTPGAPGEWDEKATTPGSVIYYDKTYHMWYSGHYGDTYIGRIGLATSPDGITWTKEINNQVLDVGPAEAWDESIRQIDLSSFQKGVYLITIRSKDFVTTLKIIRL